MTRPNNLPDYLSSTNRVANRTSLLIALLTGAVFLLFSAYLVRLTVVNKVENSFLSTKNLLSQSVKLGDKQSIERVVGTMIADDIVAVVVNIVGDNTPTKPKILTAKPFPSELYFNKSRLFLYNSDLIFTKTFEITRSTNEVFELTIYKSVDYVSLLLLCFGVFLTIAVIWLLILSSFRRNSRSFAEPIKKLGIAINKLNSDEVNVDELNYREIADLYRRFLNQWEKLKRNEDDLRELDRAKAIAQTTQMLAHDVRKPFSMFRAVIDCINSASSVSETKEILNDCLPAIESAMNSVNGMIADVMQVGTEPKLNKASISISKIIDGCLQSAFQFNPELDILIRTDYEHRNLVDVDSPKVSRVIANIVGNAVEHMKGKGSLWFVTSQSNDRLQLTIGNSNTYIAPEDVAQLFDAFFTKDKANGTGLGLAIAKKVTEAHEGKICCTSSREKGTEFTFDLPCSSEKDEVAKSQSFHSSDLVLKLKKSDKELANREEDINIEISSSIKVGLIDDEAVYLKALKGSIKEVDSNSLVNAKSCTEVREFLNFYESCQLLIIDIDLNDKEQDGIELTRKIRQLGYSGLICIHSDRDPLIYQPKAFEAGANLYFSKPMSKNQLARILGSVAAENQKETQQIRVLLFEDERIFQRQWQRQLGKENVDCFISLYEFKASEQAEDSSQYSYVVCDYYLADDSTGPEVAKYLRTSGLNQPFILSSNSTDIPEDERKLFDLVVSKDLKEALTKISDILP